MTVSPPPMKSDDEAALAAQAAGDPASDGARLLALYEKLYGGIYAYCACGCS